MAIGVTAKLVIKPGKNQTFEAAFARLAREVNQHEDGCEFYKIYKHSEEPDTYVVLESYVDQAALEAHRETEHFRSIGNELGPLLAAPPELSIMQSCT